MKILKVIITAVVLSMPAFVHASGSQEYVTALFNFNLYRDPDMPGLQYWMEVAEQSGGCANVALAITSSAEARKLDSYNRGPIQITEELYRSLLGRPPENEEVLYYWSGVISAYGRDSAIHTLIGTPEFQNRCAEFGLK